MDLCTIIVTRCEARNKFRRLRPENALKERQGFLGAEIDNKAKNANFKNDLMALFYVYKF
jgi:hypothetical protein